MTNNILIRTAALALVVSIAGCVTSAPEPQAPALPKVAPEQRLAAVEAAAGQDDKELAVQPLRDPQVEDLRQAADRALASRDYPAAAEALNQALLIVADDPSVLQERAEVALLQSDFERAETLAKRAYDLGSQVGPLCRRHWATIEQSRLARGETDNAASAQAQIAACTVPGINRM
jgi:Flp pilus assembly protein TadD